MIFLDDQTKIISLQETSQVLQLNATKELLHKDLSVYHLGGHLYPLQSETHQFFKYFHLAVAVHIRNQYLISSKEFNDIIILFTETMREYFFRFAMR